MNGTLLSTNSEFSSNFNSSNNSSVNEEVFSDVSQTDHTFKRVSNHKYSDNNYPVVGNTVCESVLNLHSVPEVSYSSSDDDDFFYDAPEDSVHSLMTKPGSESVSKVVDNLDQLALKDDKSDPLNSSIDYDMMYESEEEELGSIENHGSVISHLISQVKIGMDLTKVVLPTFILERRSLLEMYADFFAHPDLFVRYSTIFINFSLEFNDYCSSVLPTHPLLRTV